MTNSHVHFTHIFYLFNVFFRKIKQFSLLEATKPLQVLYALGTIFRINVFVESRCFTVAKRVKSQAIFQSSYLQWNTYCIYNIHKYLYTSRVLVLLTLPILRSLNPCHYPPACFVCFYLNAYIYTKTTQIYVYKRNKAPKQNWIANR